MSSLDKINNSISKLEKLADKGRFDCKLYQNTAGQCSYIEGNKTKSMCTKMLDLLVALYKSVKAGNHLAAEEIRIAYNADCNGSFKIDTDIAYAILEKGAFAGKWNKNIQECISKELHLDDHTRLDYRSKRNRARMRELTTVYSLLIAAQEDSSFNARVLVAIRAYIDRNPSAKEHLPEDVFAKVFPEEFRQRKEKENQPENRQDMQE